MFLTLIRYKENEKLPELVKEKLHCLSSILSLLASPAAQRWAGLKQKRWNPCMGKSSQKHFLFYFIHCKFSSWNALIVCKYILNSCTDCSTNYENIFFMLYSVFLELLCLSIVFFLPCNSVSHGLQWKVGCTNIINICLLANMTSHLSILFFK